MIMKELSTENKSYYKLLSLKCKNLQEVYAIFKENNKTYFICEYVVGEKLDFLMENETLTDKVIYHLILQLCDAVAFLHHQTPPIIHRDIKLSNIIVDNDYHLKLIDYDTIRELKTDTEHDTAFIGTRGYAPPEQYGFSQTNEKADIYAIGILIHRLMGGYQDISHYKGKYKRSIQKAASFSPEKRFQTVAQLKRSIQLERYKILIVMPILIVIIIVTIYLLIPNNSNILEQNNAVELENLEETIVCDFNIGEKNYTAMGKAKEFSIVPKFDEENRDILVPIELLNDLPDTKYTINYHARNIIIQNQNRKIEMDILSNKAHVNNYEVVVDCIPVIEKSNYQVPINFIASNLGYYFQFDEQQQNVKIIHKQQDRILLNTNESSFQFKKMNFYHSVPVLIGLEDKTYEKKLNQYFAEQLEEYYNNYENIYENTIKNNAENTLYTHYNYVRKKCFTKDFGSILLIDSDAKSLEDVDVNGIYRVKDFRITFASYNIDFKNKRLLQLDDILDKEALNVLIRQKLLYLSENMEEGYESIEKENVDEIISQMNDFFIEQNKTLTVYVNSPDWNNMPIKVDFPLEEYESLLK